MKKNPFAYLSRAPRLKDVRKLKPDEVAQPGDRFMFLHNWEDAPPKLYTDMAAVSEYGCIHAGASLKASRKTWIATEHAFDGVIYRPLKK